MVILGVDPGCIVAGFSVMKKEQHKTYLVECGYLSMQASKPLQERVCMFHDFFAQKIALYQVTDLALETPFMGKNAQNFLKLGYLRGILYLLAHKNNLVIHEFAPREVKQSVTGYGGASKDQVARVVHQLFPTLAAQKKEDVTDAIAVTLCGLWQQKTVHF